MICPRCDDEGAGEIFQAPEGGVWQIYSCPRCYMVWRSTEEDEVIRPELYNPDFKLSEKSFREMQEKPPIAPLRKK